MKTLIFITVLFVGASAQADTVVTHAKARLLPLGDNTVQGTVNFAEGVNGGVDVSGQIVGLGKNTNHGFHIHEFGDCSAVDGSSAGGHFKVGDSHHGGPKSVHRHVGDLGNIRSDATGSSAIESSDKVLSLSGANSIIGRSVVVHAGEDDLKSEPAGNSGPRVACGVIGIVK